MVFIKSKQLNSQEPALNIQHKAETPTTMHAPAPSKRKKEFKDSKQKEEFNLGGALLMVGVVVCSIGI
jgi:hypothetical protein